MYRHFFGKLRFILWITANHSLGHFAPGVHVLSYVCPWGLRYDQILPVAGGEAAEASWEGGGSPPQHEFCVRRPYAKKQALQFIGLQIAYEKQVIPA